MCCMYTCHFCGVGVFYYLELERKLFENDVIQNYK